ncbi:MAG: VWA domain-containing protein [Rhodospirillales bacterium]|jgi:uncharacterized protein|nr:VWA domain-containing protein [Rhodospirillales bacterium]
MFERFFLELRSAGVPASLREYLTLLEAMESGLADYKVEDFYYLSRSCLVKDERHIDRFDQVFGTVFKGLETVNDDSQTEIPEEWLRSLAARMFTEEEKREIEALGGWEKLMETLKERLEEQKKRHQGGSKWIGTGGTSPFGADGYNPEGIRIGQKESRHQRAVKVWDKREFKNFDDKVELGTRNIKVALRRLRKFAREGAADELDLDGTIRATAERGYLDVKLVAERHNAAKVLLFLDAGGSMDMYVRMVEELFSACRTEFKHLEYFYFHNCPYDHVWRDNKRRHDERTSLWDVLHTYPSDYKVVFVGDASMSPYEIVYPGGAVEYWNEEAGVTWMERVLNVYAHAVWLNPVEQNWWGHTQSIGMINQIMSERMFPFTLEGLDEAMRELSR